MRAERDKKCSTFSDSNKNLTAKSEILESLKEILTLFQFLNMR